MQDPQGLKPPVSYSALLARLKPRPFKAWAPFQSVGALSKRGRPFKAWAPQESGAFRFDAGYCLAASRSISILTSSLRTASGKLEPMPKPLR